MCDGLQICWHMTCRAAAAAAADAGPGRRTEPTPHFTAREGILSPRTTPGQPHHKHTDTHTHAHMSPNSSITTETATGFSSLTKTVLTGVLRAKMHTVKMPEILHAKLKRGQMLIWNT